MTRRLLEISKKLLAGFRRNGDMIVTLETIEEFQAAIFEADGMDSEWDRGFEAGLACAEERDKLHSNLQEWACRQFMRRLTNISKSSKKS